MHLPNFDILSHERFWPKLPWQHPSQMSTNSNLLVFYRAMTVCLKCSRNWYICVLQQHGWSQRLSVSQTVRWLYRWCTTDLWVAIAHIPWRKCIIAFLLMKCAWCTFLEMYLFTTRHWCGSQIHFCMWDSIISHIWSTSLQLYRFRDNCVCS